MDSIAKIEQYVLEELEYKKGSGSFRNKKSLLNKMKEAELSGKEITTAIYVKYKKWEKKELLIKQLQEENNILKSNGDLDSLLQQIKRLNNELDKQVKIKHIYIDKYVKLEEQLSNVTKLVTPKKPTYSSDEDEDCGYYN